VYFYNSLIGQGVGGSNSFSFFAFGQQLYSWSASASTPTMELGTFYTIGVGAGSGLGFYTATVTDPPATPRRVQSRPPGYCWEWVYSLCLDSIFADGLPDLVLEPEDIKGFLPFTAIPLMPGRSH